MKLFNYSLFCFYAVVGRDCGKCEVGQVMCTEDTNGESKCINRSLVCDQNYDCPLREDESDCNIDFSEMFNCSDGSMYIQHFKRCNSKSIYFFVILSSFQRRLVQLLRQISCPKLASSLTLKLYCLKGYLPDGC